jgi:hypothetical protein
MPNARHNTGGVPNLGQLLAGTTAEVSCKTRPPNSCTHRFTQLFSPVICKQGLVQSGMQQHCVHFCQSVKITSSPTARLALTILARRCACQHAAHHCSVRHRNRHMICQHAMARQGDRPCRKPLQSMHAACRKLQGHNYHWEPTHAVHRNQKPQSRCTIRSSSSSISKAW